MPYDGGQYDPAQSAEPRLSLTRKSLAVFSIGMTVACSSVTVPVPASARLKQREPTRYGYFVGLHSMGNTTICFTSAVDRATGTSSYLMKQGSLRHAVQRMSEVVTAALDQNDLAVDQLDWLIPHQANKRIVDSIAGLNLPTRRSSSQWICRRTPPQRRFLWPLQRPTPTVAGGHQSHCQPSVAVLPGVRRAPLEMVWVTLLN